MKRFEESKPRTKAGTQKRQCTSKIKKRKLKNRGKKQWKDLERKKKRKEQDESDTGDKNKVL